MLAKNMNPKLNTFNQLVFQALGSSFNREDIFLCVHELNSYKARLWGNKALMEDTKFRGLVKDALAGALPSSAYLSALRSTVGVYKYMNVIAVTTRMQESMKNVETELSNAVALTGDNDAAPVAKAWTAFLKSHLLAIDTFGKRWLKNTISETSTSIDLAIKIYEALHAQLKTKEGPQPTNQPTRRKKTYIGNQNKLRTKREAALRTKVNAANALRTKIDKAKEAIDKLYEDIHAQLDPAKTKKQRVSRKTKASAVVRDSKKLMALDRDFGLRTREVEEVPVSSVRKIINDFKKDKKQLAVFKMEATTPQMPGPA